MDRSQVALRHADAERARRYAVELVVEARACRQRAEELRRQLDSRRLRIVPGGSGAEGVAGQHAVGGAVALGGPAGHEAPAGGDAGHGGPVAGGGVA
jgi:hypothetical protein